ncbi:MAG: Serine protease, subtilase family [uncultured Rubrobacteraceae bacterium]|uniref:Serine protease, subtilase family n=1 Tax=uncultured Rubrobacteraceae bacterium TaxID=349277 RepID=A0A6J4P592_9ACTN|nr:MAG: Serine protease, subtilase family [uncultured Rubrobacteraceae bacterium]
MSVSQRVSLLAGVFTATLAAFVVLQGATQEAQTQPVGEEPTYQEGSGRAFAPGEIIVVLEEPAGQADLRALNEQTDATIEEDLPRSDVNVVDLPRDLSVAEGVRQYEDSPDVAYAEPNFKLQPTEVPNDPRFGELWGLDNTGQTGGTVDADVDAPEVWGTTKGSPEIVVAVIDEGIDVNHPDLRENVWINQEEASGIVGRDDDGNGYVDDVNGWDFANNDSTVYDPDPLNGGKGDEHGTHVAGTIAAVGNNGVGITGVNWDTQVAALKFLGPDVGYTSDAIEAINYAVRERMPISNNSWGGGDSSRSLKDAIARADAQGHLFVAAAGNGGKDGVGDNNDTTPHYPSSYDVPNVVSVAATGHTDRLASFSNFGSSTVDLAAPGVGILSTLPGGYGKYSGTSMATPHVAGMAALIKSEDPGLDDGQIKAQILQYVDEKASLEGKVATGGRLNAVKSVTENVDIAPPSVTSPKPAPRSNVRDRTPKISAVVTDNRTDLGQPNIDLYLDGKKRAAAEYDAGADRLTFIAPKLSYGGHKVKVVATDEAGNTRTKSWSFKVVR